MGARGKPAVYSVQAAAAAPLGAQDLSFRDPPQTRPLFLQAVELGGPRGRAFVYPVRPGAGGAWKMGRELPLHPGCGGVVGGSWCPKEYPLAGPPRLTCEGGAS